ncbi:uncharacterized protein LOC144340954 [Macaca mulatta]
MTATREHSKDCGSLQLRQAQSQGSRDDHGLRWQEEPDEKHGFGVMKITEGSASSAGGLETHLFDLGPVNTGQPSESTLALPSPLIPKHFPKQAGCGGGGSRSSPTPESCWEWHPKNFPRLISVAARGAARGESAGIFFLRSRAGFSSSTLRLESHGSRNRHYCHRADGVQGAGRARRAGRAGAGPRSTLSAAPWAEWGGETRPSACTEPPSAARSLAGAAAPPSAASGAAATGGTWRAASPRQAAAWEGETPSKLSSGFGPGVVTPGPGRGGCGSGLHPVADPLPGSKCLQLGVSGAPATSGAVILWPYNTLLRKDLPETGSVDCCKDQGGIVTSF